MSYTYEDHLESQEILHSRADRENERLERIATDDRRFEVIDDLKEVALLLTTPTIQQ